MADQRIAYTEEMVGSGHPTKADTLNRLALVDHGTDGQHTLSGFQGSQFAADAGANDTYVITLDPVPAAYFTGMMIVFTANTANTGAATINVNSLGAKAIKKQKDVALGDGDIKAGQTVVLVYDGTNFQLVNPPSALTITGGTNTFNLTNGTASLDVAAGKTVNIDDDVTVSAELHVEAATHVNQDLTSDASPTFAGVNTAAITAPSNSLVIKPTTDATTAVQVQDKDGNAILTVDTTNDRVGIGTTSPTSPLHGAGATSLGYTTITSSGTAGNYTTYFLNASSGEVILTLPAAATYAGRIYHIVRVQTYPSAYNCIVACQSGEYINGEASLALENNYDRVTAQSNGTGWIILGR